MMTLQVSFKYGSLMHSWISPKWHDGVATSFHHHGSNLISFLVGGGFVNISFFFS